MAVANIIVTDGEPAIDRFRSGKAYTIAQAARLADTTPATVRRWLVGYAAPGHRMAPVFGAKQQPEEGEQLLVSFLELVEIAVVARFRQGAEGHPVSLDRLRRAHAYARDAFNLPYPFASLNLRERGGHVLHEFAEQRDSGAHGLVLSLNGQWELPGLVRQELRHLDFEQRDSLALRWFPKGRSVPIVLDPRIAAGRPVIYRRGVTLETIAARWRAGEPITSIAEDYELEPSTVESVLRYAA